MDYSKSKKGRAHRPAYTSCIYQCFAFLYVASLVSLLTDSRAGIIQINYRKGRLKALYNKAGSLYIKIIITFLRCGTLITYDKIYY